MKYRVGRKTGLVILTTNDSKEVATCRTKEIAKEICSLLNSQSKVNVALGGASTCGCGGVMEKTVDGLSCTICG